MTAEEAIAKLEKSGVRFRLLKDSVRDCPDRRCPIVALAECMKAETWDNSEWAEAADAIGMSYDDAVLLSKAADYATPPAYLDPIEKIHIAALRAQLVSLCDRESAG